MKLKRLPASLQYTQLCNEGICPKNFQKPILEVPAIYQVMTQPISCSIKTKTGEYVRYNQLSTSHTICYGTKVFSIFFENLCYGKIAGNSTVGPILNKPNPCVHLYIPKA